MTSNTPGVTIAYFISDRGNRRVLGEWLGDRYDVVTGGAPGDVFDERSIDLCIVDPASFARHRDAFEAHRESQAPRILPYLLIGQVEQSGLDSGVRQSVDEVITTPIGQRELGIRLESLLRLRALSRELEEKNASLERKTDQLEYLMNAAAHDLRNPLTIAKGYVERIDDGDPVEAIRTALDHMETLIDNLLAVDRIEEDLSEADREPVDLATLLETAWDRVRSEEATLNTTAVTELRIHAVPDLVTQLVVNLFRNAIEHGEESVTVRVGTLDDDNGIYVSDDGPGIPEGDREAVLEEGYSTEGGSGFGLAIVTSVANAHDWELELTEAELGGARFELRGIETIEH